MLCDLYSTFTKVFLFWCLEATEESVCSPSSIYEHFNFIVLHGLKGQKFKLDFNRIWHKEQDSKIVPSFHNKVWVPATMVICAINEDSRIDKHDPGPSGMQGR